MNEEVGRSYLLVHLVRKLSLFEPEVFVMPKSEVVEAVRFGLNADLKPKDIKE